MNYRNFSELNEINYSFNQMTDLSATIDQISFLNNYFERISMYGNSEVIINPKVVIELFSILIGSGIVEVQSPVIGKVIDLEGIYSIIQNMLADKQLLNFIYGNKQIIEFMGGERRLNLAIIGMRDYINTFKGEFSRPE